MVRSVREKTVRASCGPGGRLAARARALRELIGAALRAAAEALHLLGSCLDAPPCGSKATRGSEAARARPGTGRTEGQRRHPAYPSTRDSPGHSPRVAARSARTLPLAREQPDVHLLIVTRASRQSKDQPANWHARSRLPRLTPRRPGVRRQEGGTRGLRDRLSHARAHPSSSGPLAWPGRLNPGRGIRRPPCSRTSASRRGTRWRSSAAPGSTSRWRSTPGLTTPADAWRSVSSARFSD